jgi:UDP:flavonoid glycosyltransferase YjiC (YdhE family)
MEFVLLPIGSAGDVYPFIGLVMHLQQGGHQVLIIANAHFEPLIRRAGKAVPSPPRRHSRTCVIRYRSNVPTSSAWPMIPPAIAAIRAFLSSPPYTCSGRSRAYNVKW